MSSRLNDPVDYYLPLDDQEFHLNPCIGSRIQLIFHGRIRCQHCGNASRKSYSQGYCYPCFKRLARCDLCMVSPERCHFEAGTCREPEWAENFCMQSHIVYLANSSGIKVGITTVANTPTRWIDQGAVQAIPVLRVATRQISGFAEVMFKNYTSDKTQWQRMLKADDPQVDLLHIRDDLMSKISEEITGLQGRFGLQALQPLPDAQVQVIRYPVRHYPTKVVSMSFDKTPVIEGILLGIKGQYLIFDTGVINLRRFTSYDIEFYTDSRISLV
ncbi:MAG TPA: DUF2797 domain-containing protein [Gammaproteobacteria bacterium]|nr:DUF2797 domain-containing protein [Gammaproteobacteria bacterium]HIL98752.1 DUF2797 domain-containing protein [Pseudomonadales bacterium]